MRFSNVYIDQIYNEGLGYNFFKKPYNYLNKKITNKKVLKLLEILLIIIYTLFVICCGILLFVFTYPLW